MNSYSSKKRSGIVEDESLKISVIIPAYNSEKTIIECIKSVQMQTYNIFEILIYDDCSKDMTVNHLKSLAKRDNRIKIFLGKENKGAGYARSKLLSAAKGNIAAFLDSDDLWSREKLEKQVSLLKESNASIVTCGYNILSEGGQVIGHRIPPKQVRHRMMLFSNWLPTSMTIVRLDLHGAREMPSIRRRQDYAYWLNIFQLNPGVKCVSSNELLGTYKRSSASLSSSNLKNIKSNYAMFRTSLGYSQLMSFVFVMINGLIRSFRK